MTLGKQISSNNICSLITKTKNSIQFKIEVFFEYKLSNFNA